MNTRDWEEDLAQIVGDPLAFQIGYRVRDLQQKSQKFKQDGAQMLSEYVRYELDLLPTRIQVERFNQQVTQLDADFQRIEQRMQALMK